MMPREWIAKPEPENAYQLVPCGSDDTCQGAAVVLPDHGSETSASQSQERQEWTGVSQVQINSGHCLLNTILVSVSSTAHHVSRRDHAFATPNPGILRVSPGAGSRVWACGRCSSPLMTQLAPSLTALQILMAIARKGVCFLTACRFSPYARRTGHGPPSAPSRYLHILRPQISGLVFIKTTFGLYRVP